MPGISGDTTLLDEAGALCAIATDMPANSSVGNSEHHSVVEVMP
jgi:hypothetical protein